MPNNDQVTETVAQKTLSISLSTINKANLKKSKLDFAVQWLKNSWRILISPVAQVFMAIGIFPAQALSTIKKIPIIKSIIGFITRKLGNDSRTAADTFREDFVDKKSPEKHSGFFGKIWNFFNSNSKAKPFDTTNLEVKATHTPYTTDFDRQVELETFNFEHKDFKTIPTEHQYYRIHCGNNTANCSRFFIELATLSKRHPELKTITFNHSGVEGSGGTTMSQDDLINGLCAQVKLLIQNGVKPQNIELSGFSIGAATAAIAREKLRNEGIETNLFDDRTFSTMGNVVTNGFPILGAVFKIAKTLPILKELTQYVIQPLVKYLIIQPLLWLINWNMDPASAYNATSPARKSLTVVKPKSKGNGTFKTIGKYFGKFTGLFKRDNGDKVIPIHVSLLSGTENTSEKAAWKKTLFELEQQVQTHNGSITELSLPLLSELKPDNSISSDALARLKLASHNENVTDLVYLLKVGTKARRFYGVTESNAHNTTTENLTSRVKPEEMRGALRAAGLDTALSDHNGVTFYSLHHQAVKNHNDRETAAAQTGHKMKV